LTSCMETECISRSCEYMGCYTEVNALLDAAIANSADVSAYETYGEMKDDLVCVNVSSWDAAVTEFCSQLDANCNANVDTAAACYKQYCVEDHTPTPTSGGPDTTAPQETETTEEANDDICESDAYCACVRGTFTFEGDGICDTNGDFYLGFVGIVVDGNSDPTGIHISGDLTCEDANAGDTFSGAVTISYEEISTYNGDYTVFSMAMLNNGEMGSVTADQATTAGIDGAVGATITFEYTSSYYRDTCSGTVAVDLADVEANPSDYDPSTGRPIGESSSASTVQRMLALMLAAVAVIALM